MFKRLLVANRGEIALRIIHACKSLDVETVAVCSEADRDSPHLEHADEVVCIGPAQASHSYLDQETLLQAALQTECQALHPGYGFLAENAAFATRCEQQKTTFVGPRPATLRLMGDKMTARAAMERLGLPGVPGSDGLVGSPDHAETVAAEIGFPVLLKATAGGGGKGMRVVQEPDELETAFRQASLEAEKAFGNPGLYMERFVENGRHIEFQVLGDRWGRVIHLGERECSTQRSNQKLLEEAPSPCIDGDERAEVGDRIVRALREIGYLGAGTVELLRTPSGELFFMEMNTRLQVEHPVTELCTGVDLVAWQIRVAAGEPLDDALLSLGDDPLEGHAIEIRINAEDPLHGFKPMPGTIERFDAPDAWRYDLDGPVRLDSHVVSGYRIPPWYDSMIGKLIVHGTTRSEAIERMRDALDELTVTGVPTTLELHRAILDDDAFVSGDYDTPRMSRMMRAFAERAADRGNT